MKLIFILFVMLSNVLFAFDQFKEPHRFKASIQTKDYKFQLKQMRDMEIDVTGVDYKNKIIDVLLNSSELKTLEDMGMSIDIHWSQGVSINRAVDSGYHTSDEVENFLKEMNKNYPDLTDLMEIGKSFEGKAIWAIKISDNPQESEAVEPSILFNSMHHAREIMGPEVSVDIVEYLLENYDDDAKVKHWVDNNEIWVVPMLNVDGNGKVWGGDTMWRKNTSNGFGVDLNRNYPFGWNSCNGSSGFMWSPTYRGPEAGSESETQALMGLVERIKPVFDISYHSYSELVLYPYGCKNSTGATIEVMKTIGQEMGTLLGYEAGTPWEILYEADGSDIDWMLGEHQVIPYVIELNSRAEGFQPPYNSTRDKTVELNRKAWQLLLDKLDGAGVRGIISNFSGTGLIQVLKDSAVVQTYNINPDGSFHIVLPPGSYQLQSDYFPSQVVEIKDQRIDFTF